MHTAAPPTATIIPTLVRFHHRLRQLILSIRQLRVLPVVLPLMTKQLPARVQHIVALRPDAVYVVAYPTEAAGIVRTRFVLHELLEAISR